ncbi:MULTISPECIES: transglycosylase SLT domain-containing protein [Pseudomonas]|uniref:transglycosylase SLT domain-containing protein n=1 Tax=Pseudomonas TaxID=286 RepID=UPI000F56E921|nr:MULTISPECIES: transglycosylase SLT domain-containing protein [Pseudomonas]MDQ0741100.1 soluble lytic murein transglycosylase-like protein [Pseudomonas sp. W4I3]MDQ0980379.1 soluble lytic murein transglycosylase-like protein [Pseudomonas synxantha]
MTRYLLVGLLLLTRPSWADAFCWEQVGASYDIEPELLFAIAQVESSLRTDALNHNHDGSRDIGLMQINSRHLPWLSEMGIDEGRLLNDPCLSIAVGASILKEFIGRFGYSWEAVGAYNAGGSASRATSRQRYAKRVQERYHMMRSDLNLDG